MCVIRGCVINKERHVDPTPTYHRGVSLLCDDSDSEDVVRAGIMGVYVITKGCCDRGYSEWVQCRVSFLCDDRGRG